MSCRLDLYNTVIDDFDDDFVFDDKVELVFDIFNNVVLTQRDNINKLNYEKYLNNKKLRLISNGLL